MSEKASQYVPMTLDEFNEIILREAFARRGIQFEEAGSIDEHGATVVWKEEQ